MSKLAHIYCEMSGQTMWLWRSECVRYTFLISLCVLFGACASTQGGAKISRPLPKPSVLMAKLRERSAARHNLRALGRVTVFSTEGRLRLKAVLVAQRPRSFRMETLSPFEQPIDVMASGGEHLWLLTKGKLFVGPATPENIARVLPLPLQSEELVELLLGGPPVARDLEPSDIRVDGRQWLLALRGKNGDHANLWIQPEQLNVVRAELMDGAGNMRIQLKLEDFRDLGDGGPQLPNLVRARVPPRSLDVRVRLLETTVGEDIALSIFSLEPEDGIVAEPL
ncbi:MAG: DUF4292 domain-containing protein [Myxococcales bacterium]|nr:DUF4292 domain-containing protein [Myxococcales bacterium]